MTKPFAGIRILDFTRYVAGPFGTYQLALLGADVIKIEPKAGEEMRHSQLSKEWAAKGLGPSFLGINSNKRSLTLDLQKPKAVEIVRRLAKDADVVWENFRPGVMDRFGLGYEVLKAINPRLIYCAVSGFGQNGPERGTAAFDGKLQAMSGIMSITGHEDKGPTRAGFALCDTIGGMTAAFAVSSALYQRTRDRRGPVRRRGDARRGAVVPVGAGRRIHRRRPHPPAVRQSLDHRQADRQPLQMPARAICMLAVMTDRQFTGLMKGIGREDALADPRFADWPARIEHEAALRVDHRGRARRRQRQEAGKSG